MKALDVAKYIVDSLNLIDKPISNMRLNILLYLIYKDYYRMTNQLLFSDVFKAYKLGPVIEDVYYEYCAWGAIPIRRTNDKFKVDNEKISPLIPKIIEYTKIAKDKFYEFCELSHDKAWTITLEKQPKSEISPFLIIETIEEEKPKRCLLLDSHYCKDFKEKL